MENLEEVLQALDEFQKMRPSEIPRELEDYLCWVAKTGDPVYQWPLIKTLFREKLTRVMTDFYESCPTLDLAPCPNVEHFNYDTMKSNLLERLESFTNAPFTVQRICELLTAPRQQYNRVDKFMRAIEKNILVVSTREPGPIARRNENGDGMVNGSVDEDTSVTQPPQDVEMEYWEKDCSSTVTISVHTVENESPLLHTVVPSTTTVVKNVFGTEDLSHDKVESTSSSKAEIGVSNFMSTATEFPGVSNLNSQAQTQDSQMSSTIQNLSTIVPESSGIVSDVSEAMMNEDTNSQPSLELENDTGDNTESTRKVQTTFQTKDFSPNENKSSKFYIDSPKVNEKTEIPVHIQEGSGKSNDVTAKLIVEPKMLGEQKELVSSLDDNLLNTSNEHVEDALKLGSGAQNSQSSIASTPVSTLEHKAPLHLENASIGNISSVNNSEQSTSKFISSTDDASATEHTTNASEDMSIDVENLKQSKETEDAMKAAVEDPSPKDNSTQNFNSDKETSKLTITEAVEDETRVIKSIVPDPIPIVEEPKDTEPATVKENISPIVEISEETENQNSTTMCEVEREEKMSVEETTITELESNNLGSVISKTEDNNMVIESAKRINNKEQDTTELMDVDEEETMPVFRQEDESMEQEVAQSSRS